MGVRQVRPWDRWPSGDSQPIAVLSFELPELTERYGFMFEEGLDDLDRFRFAAIEIAPGQQAWIAKHDGDPNPGTVVRVDAEADPGQAQDLVLAALGLQRPDLLWAAPERVLTGR